MRLLNYEFVILFRAGSSLECTNALSLLISAAKVVHSPQGGRRGVLIYTTGTTAGAVPGAAPNELSRASER